MYRFFFKRVIDLLAALVLLVLTFPVFLVVMIVMFFDLKGNPFFFQVRPGRHGRLFKLVKFRTMNGRKDAEGNLLPDAERLTKTGRALRRTSLDEIPQLLNVINGDMSLVGPRPLLIEYLPLYNSYQSRRHEVLPGITGWAQVNGRNAISWQQKFEYDVWYVDHLSFKTDMRILFRTLQKVMRKDGVNSSALITMEKFSGNTE
jgi:undecaprenyl phosphate N,N'-diacetylbacillosamine 1-phosphate transferase